MREEEAEARRKGVKLGKTVLEEFYTVFAGMAAYYQPDPAGQKKGADEKKFLQYAELACLNAYRAAAFQSPTFKAIAVTAPGGQGGALLPAPASDPKVIDLQAVDPARAADTYRRLIAAATNAA